MILACPYCGQVAILTSSAAVYGGRDYGPIYLCPSYPACDSYVGVHKGTTTPLGRMANKELRAAKVRAHAAFDPLWRSSRMSRREAYRVMQRVMNMTVDQAHIGLFDVAECDLLVARLAEKKAKVG